MALSAIQKVKKAIANNFNKAADTYHNHALIQQDITHRIMRLCPDFEKKDLNIIDIGCGTGFFTEKLIQIYPECHMTLCDLSENMLQKAKYNLDHKSLTTLCCDGEALTVTDRQYDLIASNMTFQWFLDLENTLKSYQKQLTKDGHILFSSLMGKSFYEWYDSIQQAGGNISVPFENHALPKNIPYQIVEKATIIQEFPDPSAFLKMLKSIGAHTNTHSKNNINPSILKKACNIFSEKYSNKITYDVVMVLI